MGQPTDVVVGSCRMKRFASRAALGTPIILRVAKVMVADASDVHVSNVSITTCTSLFVRNILRYSQTFSPSPFRASTLALLVFSHSVRNVVVVIPRCPLQTLGLFYSIITWSYSYSFRRDFHESY